METKDFTPTEGQITLHGLGFIQVSLPGNQRIHVWHPDLPKRRCFARSPIHNHRFSFLSTVLVGTQLNHRFRIVENSRGDHDMISHDGPRLPSGSRQSYVSGRCYVQDFGIEAIPAGMSYKMEELEYHSTPNDGVVVTLMQKLHEGTTHAHSIIQSGYTFDQDFDRYQLSDRTLWAFVVEAMKEGGK